MRKVLRNLSEAFLDASLTGVPCVSNSRLFRLQLPVSCQVACCGAPRPLPPRPRAPCMLPERPARVPPHPDHPLPPSYCLRCHERAYIMLNLMCAR